MAKVLQCNMALLLTHALKCQQLRKSKVVMVTIKVPLKKYSGEPYDIVPDLLERFASSYFQATFIGCTEVFIKSSLWIKV